MTAFKLIVPKGTLNRHTEGLLLENLLETVDDFGIDRETVKVDVDSIHDPVNVFLSLDYTARKEYYKELNCDTKDALYDAVTDQHIARVPKTTREAINATYADKTSLDSCWRSVSWYHHTGDADDRFMMKGLAHLRPIYDALNAVYDDPLSEGLTPTDKLKRVRADVMNLSSILGKLVTYDDETTEEMLSQAEVEVTRILATLRK